MDKPFKLWKRMKPVKQWAILFVAISLVVFAACAANNNHKRSRTSKYPPSFTDIQRLVKANVIWDEYQKGGDYLRAVQAHTWQYPKANDPTCDVRPINEIAERVTVDFLRTLKPHQVKLLRSKLPFSMLTADQKKILYLEPGYYYNSKVDIESSYIRMEVWKVGTQDPYANFYWCIKTADGREKIIETGGTNFYLDNVAKWQQPW